ncbi:RHS repeat domain-containing protein [Kordia sp.]|uniref:RHS repeat domain-containing protein n=1 Tax=Kordia sp. TaxID=1965332 RepID=UPI003B5929BC
MIQSKPIKIVGYNYTYQYKDHLGNIRLSYEDINGDGNISPKTEIKEENHYYPFGLKMRGFNNQITGRDHQYGYNGIEESNELGNNMLEMDMRQYDAAIARWVVIDPVTHFDYSPYQSFDNNPIYWADPSGTDAEGSAGNNIMVFTGDDAIAAYDIIRDGWTSDNNNSNNRNDNEIDPEEAQWIRADTRNFAHDGITYRYELVDDEKNIHKITLTGMSWIVKPSPPYYGYRRYRESVIEVIIESSKGNPRVVSSIMTNGIYSWGKCDKGHYHNFLEGKLYIEENYKSPLTNYVTNKLLNALDENSNYNPFNGSQSVSKMVGYVIGGIGAAQHFSRYEPKNKYLKFFFRQVKQ